MNNFFDELYENFPELEKSKEGIDKAVYYLKDNKPVFNASSEFKNNLKSRINGLVGLKARKRSDFLIFAIPLSSFVFIVAGFLYYFKDITFLNGPNNVKNFEVSNLNIDDNLSNNNELKSENESTVLDDNNNQESKDEIVENVNEVIISSKKIDNNSNNKIDNNTQEIYKNDAETSVENSEIITVLEAVGETYDFKISDSNDSEFFFDSNINSIGVGASSINDMEMNRSFKIEENYETFMSYCDNNGGVIYEAGNDQICRIDKKECLSSNYTNGTCEFKEIK